MHSKMKEHHITLRMIWLFVLLCPFFVQPVFAQHGHGSSKDGKAAQKFDDVVVVAEKIDAFVEQNPSQVVSMTAKEIETRNFLQVHEVLGAMPGVDVKPSSSGLGTRIAIRGGGGSGSVLVLIDGRPAAIMQFGGVDLSSIPIDIIRKITVFKPPVPVWLGPDSAAGAIYIETKTKKRRAKKDISGKVRLSAGSYGACSGSATGRFDNKKRQFLVTGGYAHKDGRRDNSRKDQGHFSLGYDKKNDSGNLVINSRAFVSDHGVAGPTYNPTPNARQRYEKASLDVKYKGFSDALDYNLKTWGDYKNLDETSNSGTASALDSLSAGLGGDIFILDEDEKNELKIGGLAEHIRVDHTFTGEHDRTRLSGHGEYQIRTRPFVYTLGARGEYTDDFDFSPGGHAGISWTAGKDTVFKANAGYSEHVPSFGQLYQPSHGSIDQVRGNPDLDKEKIISLTTGMEHRFMDRHTLSFSLFCTETRDLIKYRRDANNVNEPYNVNRAVKQGAETTFKFALSKQTGIDATYIYQDTENKDNGKKLSYAPRHSLKLVFKTVFETQTRLEWITRGYSKQYSDDLNTESQSLEDYFTTDVKLSHPVSLLNRKTLLFVNLHNLFDQDFSSHFGYPDEGFKVELGLSMTF